MRWCFVFCLFLLFSCQSSEQETAETVTGQFIPVSLQLQWVTQAQFAGYYVALEKGWYKEEGFDLSIYPGGPDIVAVDLVTSGARDFGTTLLADLVVSIGKGKKAVCIAQLQQNNGLRLITKTTSNIRNPRDFIGKKVGVWLGGWEVQFNALLAQQGIHPDSVELVSQGFSMHPLLDGRLDVASAMIYNEYFMVLEAGIRPEAIRIIDYADYELDFPGDVLFTSADLKNKNPELCRKMVRASFRGWKYAMGNIDEAVDIVLKHDKSGVATKDHQLKMMSQIATLIKGSENEKMGTINQDSYHKMVQLLTEYKMLQSPLSIQDVYTDDFIE